MQRFTLCGTEILKKSIQLKQIDFKWFPIDECPKLVCVRRLANCHSHRSLVHVCQYGGNWLMFIFTFRFFNFVFFFLFCQVNGPHRQFIRNINHYILFIIDQLAVPVARCLWQVVHCDAFSSRQIQFNCVAYVPFVLFTLPTTAANWFILSVCLSLARRMMKSTISKCQSQMS